MAKKFRLQGAVNIPTLNGKKMLSRWTVHGLFFLSELAIDYLPQYDSFKKGHILVLSY